MKRFLALAAPALLFANPAAAVEVVDILQAGDNEAIVFSAEAGLLEVDFLIGNPSPITLLLKGDEVIEFNSVTEFFTGITLGKNVTKLTLTLDGATFETVGSVEPAFSEADVVLSNDLSEVLIRFNPAGEGFGVVLGNVLGGENFVIAPSPDAGVYALTVNAAVPEPATWGMMIAGFGLVGFVLRRRERFARA